MVLATSEKLQQNTFSENIMHIMYIMQIMQIMYLMHEDKRLTGPKLFGAFQAQDDPEFPWSCAQH